MALTLDYMRSLVLSRLDDADFETTYLDQALNEAQWDITNNHNFNFLEKTSTQTLLAGTSSVDYPSDLRTLVQLRVNGLNIPGYDITEQYVDFADYQEMILTNPSAPANQPVYWTTYAGKILFQTPADIDYTITINYIRTSPRVDGTIVTTFDIPEQFQELLKIGAYMRIAKREDDYDVKGFEQIDYNKALVDLIHTYTRNVGARKKRVMRVIGR